MATLRRSLLCLRQTLNSINGATRASSETVPIRSEEALSRSRLGYSFCSIARQSSDTDLSNEENKRRIFNRLLYRSRQSGFLELDLVLGNWVEEHLHSMDDSGIKALVEVLDLENPDLWKWLTSQESPPEEVTSNPVFSAVRDRVMHNLNHASPETRAEPGQPWVRGWDDFKKGRDTPISGNQ
ncbi:hypothetical protein Syun_020064 [Stephania yunnanensis]|uniref:Succinate dehydrogenase assembly factor 2, mitochondrial n=1 Tax=Stephania yunnanensis TaxID=152371 RepID=A0AAP0IX79_9MAGN